MALWGLHENNYVYKDLRPENILIDDLGYLYLTDFSTARSIATNKWGVYGVTEYLAPELLNKDSCVTQ